VSASPRRGRRPGSPDTRAAILGAARALFAAKGYAGTSLDEIVAGAQVTKGALYHHFRGKQELFEAAFVSVEDAAADRIRRTIRSVSDPWEKALTGLREFLAVTRTEAYRRYQTYSR